MKKVSLTDIAKSLNVSTTLVSMVLNGKGDENGINVETQRKVFKKAEELNYVPHSAARALRLGRSETIGLIVSDISNPFFSKIAGQIEKKASKAGYNLFVCSSNEDAIKESNLIQMLINRQTDGLIISSAAKNKKDFLNLKKENYPFVLIDRHIDIDDINFVSADNYQGALVATEHIINQGIEDIIFLSITPSHISTIKYRTKGFIDALKNKNIILEKEKIVSIDYKNIQEETDNALNKLLNVKSNKQAIFATNNNIALSCLRYFNRNKINIPDDVALLSFDDIDLFEFSQPRITSVSQSAEKIGDTAINLLLEDIKMKGEAEKKQIILPADLIIRESCNETSNNKHL